METPNYYTTIRREVSNERQKMADNNRVNNDLLVYKTIFIITVSKSQLFKIKNLVLSLRPSYPYRIKN